MKKLAVILLVLLPLHHAFPQIPPSVKVPQELKTAYATDVYKLALQNVAVTNSLYHDSILIPQFIEDSIWSGLGAIYNLYNLADRDSIFDYYCIHDENCSGLPIQYLFISVDTNYSWTKHWKNNESLTGYAPLDSFLIQFGYNIAHFSNGAAEISSSTHLNMPAFLNVYVDSLIRLDGIEEVYYDALFCCHNQIFYVKQGDTSFFSFVLGWGDTHWDCLNTITWTFSVHNGLAVLTSKKRSIQVSNPIPAYRKPQCHITSALPPELNDPQVHLPFYPNPARDWVTLSAPAGLMMQVTIYDLLGYRVRDMQIPGQTRISLSGLRRGLYLVRIYDNREKKEYMDKLMVE